MRASNIITRSSGGKPDSRAESEMENQKATVTDNGEDNEESSIGEDELPTGAPPQQNEKDLQKELENMKGQLKAMKLLIEGQQQIRTSSLEPITQDEFPPLGQATGQNVPGSAQQSIMASWKDKVTTPLSPIGMPLKFVPPVIENGSQIVHIESHDVAEMINVWEKAVVVYVVGGYVSVDIIRGYIRKHWTNVTMPIIHAHEEGYYVLRFNSDDECSEILKGGPYFLNKAPMIVKKWSSNFDFKEEILRVIPVWVRLPSLPLHCWGVESLSRIVSAVGVPIIADECTAKQLKVSYARVLVEVDITQEFVKEIKIRDTTGREFIQKAIPEWRPFYCRTCNKVGHECKEGNEVKQDQKKQMSKLETKGGKESKVWVPTTLASIIKGVTGIDQLRAKIEAAYCIPDQNVGMDAAGQKQIMSGEMNVTASNTVEETGGTEEDQEAAWTQVSHNRVARKNSQYRGNGTFLVHGTAAPASCQHTAFEPLAECEVEQTEENLNERGGNPQIPSIQ